MSPRENNINIFNDTLEFIKENGTLKNSVIESKRKTRLISDKGKNDQLSIKKDIFFNNVFVTKNRTFEAAIKLHKEYPNDKIAVLNFASATTPGGGVTKGSSAQEECLCRGSTLYPCLTTNWLWNGFYSKNRNNPNPLHTDDVVYIPDIIICKTDDGKYTKLTEKEFITVDVITCAAPNLREHPNNAFNIENSNGVTISDEELFKLHLSRARAILNSAKENNIKILVLGAFGCGAFKNDPKVVAKAYKEALKDYVNDFKEIEFAIFCKGYETENFDAFEEEFR